MKFVFAFSRATSHFISLSAIAASTGLLGACVDGPSNDQVIVDRNDLSFEGFAQHPGATIQIEAFSHRTQDWQVVGTATASTLDFTFGKFTLHRWTKPNWHFLTDVPDGPCFWDPVFSSGCSPQPGDSSARFRFRELGSDIQFLYTFDAGGVDCVEKKVAAGRSWLNAGIECASGESPVLTLKTIN